MNKKELIENILTDIADVINEKELSLDDASLFLIKQNIDKIFKQTSKKRMVRDGREWGHYITKDVVMCAYSYILDNGGSHSEALEAAIKVCNKTEEWLAEVRNKPSLYSKDVVKAHDDHPEQQSMISNGVMDRKQLERSETAVKQLKRLSKYKRINDWIKSLQSKVQEQEEKLTEVSVRSLLTEAQADRIIDFVGMDAMSNLEKAKHLRDQGYSVRIIAEFLKVDKRTVYRWLKNS